MVCGVCKCRFATWRRKALNEHLPQRRLCWTGPSIRAPSARRIYRDEPRPNLDTPSNDFLRVARGPTPADRARSVDCYRMKSLTSAADINASHWSGVARNAQLFSSR